MTAHTSISALKLKRPRLLIAAARAGAKVYRRNRDLPSLAPKLFASGMTAALPTRLLALEEKCDEERREGSLSYSPARHVRLLSAVMAEMRALSLN